MKNKKLTLKDLPTTKNPLRKVLAKRLTRQEFYLKDLDKDLPFFSELDLVVIEMKYRGLGMTKHEIMDELAKQGWPIQERTLRYYIRVHQFPRVLFREKTDKGIVSYYPADAVRHLNFTRYCLFATRDTAEKLIAFFKSVKLTDQFLLEHKSLEILSDINNEGCLYEMAQGLDKLFIGIRWTEKSIKQAFKGDLIKKNAYLQRINKIADCFEQLGDQVDSLIMTLAEKTTCNRHLDRVNMLNLLN